MHFSLSLSAGRTCMFWQRSKHRGTSHIIYNSCSLSKLYKAKTNKKESGLITQKRNKLAQASKNRTVYHEASTFGTEALMSKNNNSFSSHKSETQVVQDWLKWSNFYGLFAWTRGTPGRHGNPLRWGNPPVHIISHFNLITFTCRWGDPSRWVARSAIPANPLSWGQILPCQCFKVR